MDPLAIVVQPASIPPPSRLRALLELFRLPNVFTAMADVFLGYFFTHALTQWSGRKLAEFLLLVFSSSFLYVAGMVLNDFFDHSIDAIERPARPIPSGRVSTGLAGRLGLGLILAGVCCGWAAGIPGGTWRSGATAGLLALAVLAYDGLLKRTPLAPFVMGACRFLNVLVGMSTAAEPWRAIHVAVAGGIGVYIVGVTWFARTEARASSRWQLSLAATVMGGGLLLLAWFPNLTAGAIERGFVEVTDVSYPEYAKRIGERWYLFWTMMGLLIGWRVLRAVWEPTPGRVQAAVKHCILSLIMLDAAAAFAVRGPYAASAILLLLLPAMFLGQWIYST